MIFETKPRIEGKLGAICKKFGSAILLVLSLSTPLSAKELADGDTWSTFDDLQKLIFVRGFMEGYQYGAVRVAIRYSEEECSRRSSGQSSSQYSRCAESVEQSISSHGPRLFNIPRIIEGLNANYVDYRNKNIPISMMVEFVISSISGDSELYLSQKLENLRRTWANP